MEILAAPAAFTRRILPPLVSAVAFVVLLQVLKITFARPVSWQTLTEAFVMTVCLIAPAAWMWSQRDGQRHPWATYLALLASIGIESALYLR